MKIFKLFIIFVLFINCNKQTEIQQKNYTEIIVYKDRFILKDDYMTLLSFNDYFVIKTSSCELTICYDYYWVTGAWDLYIGDTVYYAKFKIIKSDSYIKDELYKQHFLN